MVDRTHRGRRGDDTTVRLLSQFHVDMLGCLSATAGRHISTMNEGLVATRGILPRKLVNKIRRLDSTYSVVRHLTGAYLQDTLKEVTETTAAQRPVLPRGPLSESGSFESAAETAMHEKLDLLLAGVGKLLPSAPARSTNLLQPALFDIYEVNPSGEVKPTDQEVNYSGEAKPIEEKPTDHEFNYSWEAKPTEVKPTDQEVNYSGEEKPPEAKLNYEVKPTEYEFNYSTEVKPTEHDFNYSGEEQPPEVKPTHREFNDSSDANPAEVKPTECEVNYSEVRPTEHEVNYSGKAKPSEVKPTFHKFYYSSDAKPAEVKPTEHEFNYSGKAKPTEVKPTDQVNYSGDAKPAEVKPTDYELNYSGDAKTAEVKPTEHELHYSGEEKPAEVKPTDHGSNYSGGAKPAEVKPTDYTFNYSGEAKPPEVKPTDHEYNYSGNAKPAEVKPTDHESNYMEAVEEHFVAKVFNTVKASKKAKAAAKKALLSETTKAAEHAHILGKRGHGMPLDVSDSPEELVGSSAGFGHRLDGELARLSARRDELQQLLDRPLPRAVSQVKPGLQCLEKAASSRQTKLQQVVAAAVVEKQKAYWKHTGWF
jgi:hypothetical protein